MSSTCTWCGLPEDLPGSHRGWSVCVDTLNWERLVLLDALANLVSACRHDSDLVGSRVLDALDRVDNVPGLSERLLARRQLTPVVEVKEG